MILLTLIKKKKKKKNLTENNFWKHDKNMLNLKELK